MGSNSKMRGGRGLGRIGGKSAAGRPAGAGLARPQASALALVVALLAAACGGSVSDGGPGGGPNGNPPDPQPPHPGGSDPRRAPGVAADGSKTSELPEGTVVTIGGVPITADQVERYVGLMSGIEPQYVEADWRRKALTNIALPMAAAHAILPEERDAAFVRAQALHSEARETGRFPPGVTPRYATGTWKDLGMVEWVAAAETRVGNFTALVETPGGWAFGKVIASTLGEGEEPDAFDEFTVQIVEVQFVEMPDRERHDLIQDAIDDLPIVVVDPEWEPILPALYLYEGRDRDPND